MSQLFRVYEPVKYSAGETLSLSEENSHILSRVLRKNPGDSIVLLNGNGLVAQAILIEVGKKKCEVDVKDIQTFKPLAPSIHLWIGCLKGEKLNWVVQKATELGVSEITLFQSEHSIAVKSENSIEKTNKVAIEAIRQSGNPFLPKLHYEKDLSKASWVSSKNHLNVVLDETRTETFGHIKNDSITSISLFVGPEGGLSSTEREFFKSKDCLFIRIAPYILRADTAAIAAVGMFRAAF